MGGRSSQFGRKFDRGREVFKRLITRMEVLGPDRGQVVPTLRGLQVASEAVMVREDAQVLLDPLPPQVLDRRGGGRMELATPPLQERSVGDFLDQGVREPHPVRLPVAFEQTYADKLVYLGVSFSADQVLEQRHLDTARPSTDAAVSTSRAPVPSTSSRARITFSIVVGSSMLAWPHPSHLKKSLRGRRFRRASGSAR